MRRYLNDTGSGTPRSGGGGDPDSLYMDYCKLYRFSGVQPRRALQFVFSRYEINVIKTVCSLRWRETGGRSP